MQDAIFINNAIDDSFKLYVNNIDKKDSVLYNSFECSVIRMLIMIYGDRLLDSYNNKNEEMFRNILSDNNYDVNEVTNFINVFDRYYKMFKRQENKAIKKKNKYFNMVQKYLIDMFFNSNNKENADEFYKLLFTINSASFYRKSIALLSAYNPYEIDEYYKKKNV